MHVVHLTASTFYGGPERQMLGLAEHLPASFRSTYASFPEDGRCGAFLDQVQAAGHGTHALTQNNSPGEVTQLLRDLKADVLVTHTYKPNILGRLAARRVGIPCVVVSRGWTAENLKVRVYETADRVNLRFVDAVVAVSDGQAAKVRKAGVPGHKLHVIRNAARLNAFASPDPAYRDQLRSQFAVQVSQVILAAGRLSPEKGFAVLVEAAADVLKAHPTAGVVLFGDGGERPKLEARLAELGIADRVRLPGFTAELDRYLPWADVVVLPSFTEGLPNVALEASAAGVAVVATAVGGTPEVIADGVTGLLVPSGQPAALAAKLTQVLGDGALRRRLGEGGRRRMAEQFTFAAQAKQYATLFEALVQPMRKAG